MDAIKFHGRRLRSLREAKSWSQGELHRRSGVERSLISRLERGDRDNAYAHTVAQLARALGVSVDYLLGLSDEPSPPVERDHPVTPVTSEAARLFAQLSEQEQDWILNMVRQMRERPRSSK